MWRFLLRAPGISEGSEREVLPVIRPAVCFVPADRSFYGFAGVPERGKRPKRVSRPGCASGQDRNWTTSVNMSHFAELLARKTQLKNSLALGSYTKNSREAKMAELKKVTREIERWIQRNSAI